MLLQKYLSASYKILGLINSRNKGSAQMKKLLATADCSNPTKHRK